MAALLFDLEATMIYGIALWRVWNQQCRVIRNLHLQPNETSAEYLEFQRKAEQTKVGRKTPLLFRKINNLNTIKKTYKMEAIVIIEKASDGSFSAFAENVNDFGLCGFGNTVDEAKNDLLLAYEEMKEEFFICLFP